MEEYVQSPHEEIYDTQYTICTRCGRMVPRKETLSTSSAQTGGNRPEQDVLCERCTEELLSLGDWTF